MEPSGQDNRVLIWGLLLLALLLKSAIPAGFMPGVSRDGAPAMVVCTGSGPGHHMADKDSGKTKKNTCPFAPVISQGLSTPAVAASTPAVWVDTQIFQLTVALLGNIAPRSYFSQGPPLSL